MKNLENVSLLIIGYDPYKDVWDHYFELLNKYWPNRPKTYLATNTLIPDYKDVTVLPTSENAEWSKKVYDSLTYIDTDYVILLLEDFFTTRTVENRKIYDLLEIIKENQIQYCKLLNQAKFRGKTFKNYEYLRISEKSDTYAISLQPAIWEKSFLKECVGPDNYNAWIFELHKAKKFNINNDRINVISDDRNILEITHAIVQSKYLRKAVRVFKRQNYKLNLSKRGVMSVSDTIKYRSKIFFAQYTPKVLWNTFKAVGRVLNVNFVSDKYKG
ncbi:hypothetical protein [Streptococcus uberis]|uniref:hypothetical protein n=1 Tax=Streptococcus uberis TaxID=1349 RepID=UPI0006204541|nr:hypothetical protein [Streptococcus uberis]KKF50430.1 hypothetical protein AF60_08095 [Streptococcus uberis S6261]